MAGMAVISAAGDGISEAETLLLSQVDIVTGSVDFKGRPSVRSKSGCWKSNSFIIGVELAERFCYFGVSSNLLSYLTGQMGQSTAAAAANLNAFNGTATLSPILGAFLADFFLGRYRTIIFSSLFYTLGLGFLSLSAAVNSFNTSDCKSAAYNISCSPSQLHIIFFFFSLYLVALAQGGHRPCLLAFGANQFDAEDEKESAAKSSFFNWYFWFSCFGVLLALSVLNYIQENLSWELGFGIPSTVMCFSLITFCIGTMTYRFHINRDRRRPFVGINQAFVEAARNHQPAFAAASNELEAQRILPQECAQFEYLGRAQGSMEGEKTCSNGNVESAKAILRLAPIWCTCLGYSIVYAQPATLFTKQASTLDRHIGSSFQMPAASLQLWIVVSIMAFVPVYDWILVPIARVISKKPSGLSTLQRVGTGLFLSLISIVIAALVERKRLEIASEHGLVDRPTATVPMSVWWLVPQYLISGVADVFAMAGLQEFFYDQAPGKLKSIGLALYLSIIGIGLFLSSFLIYIITKATNGHGQGSWFSDNLNQAHLDRFYWLLAGISGVSMAAYVYFARSYVYSRESVSEVHLI